MPELPEVETIRRGLEDLIVGKKILDIMTDSPKQVQPSLEKVKKAVVGSVIKTIGRRAKLLQLFLSNDSILVFHLKLTGRLLVRKAGEPKDDWQHITFKIKDQPFRFAQGKKSKIKNNELELRFCDARKFGWVKLIDDQKELEKLLSELGPEPFVGQASFPRLISEQPGQAHWLTFEIFRKILSSSARPIKIILMDQQKLSGIGNIYASEALFLAGIDPRRPAKKVSLEEIKKLYEAIIEVLKLGIKYRGASDQYYLDATGHKGAYQNHFLVYGRQGENCPNKCGQIKRIVVGGRGSFFCPKCQS